jgi:GH24 family phage-related lysozyme (muramidase)
MDERYLSAIRGFEGFTPRATWDYRQNSNGYGTRAKFPGEVIDQAEAERRLQAEIGAARAIVERHAPNADEGTKAALTSLTYNAGADWVSSGLGDAVRRGDMPAARERFQQYTRAGGEVLPGLVKRRQAEAEWIGGGAPSSAPPVSTASATPAPQQEQGKMDWLAMLSSFMKGGGGEVAAGGGAAPPMGDPRADKRKSEQAMMASVMSPMETGTALPQRQRGPVDMSQLAQILSSRSRLGV